MLENLVESKKNTNNKLSGLLVSAAFLVSAILMSAMLWNLFAKDLTMNGDLELSVLTMPVAVAETEPLPEKPAAPQRRDQPQAAKNTIIERQANIARVDEMQTAPDKISVTKNTQASRPDEPFVIGNTDTKYAGENQTTKVSNNGEITGSIIKKPDPPIEIPKKDIPKPPPILTKKEEKPTAPVSGGVVNGKAIRLPTPPYPPPAKAAGAKGDVSVRVTIDEQGNVISAEAVGGHPLLRDAAERAARGAKFRPTTLSKQPVKVTGLIIYRFS